jgi:hypothetical protein
VDVLITYLLFHDYQYCNQDLVNLSVGIWWILSFCCSLIAVRDIPPHDQTPPDGERLLEEDHSSPVGYKVPKLPDFEIDPSCVNQGHPCFSIHFEFAIGMMLSLVVGLGMIAFAFTDWEDDLYVSIKDYVAGAY